ncbi:MAG TPA: AAA family ATPase [Candidatus Ozemobacteraceae bacterium]|nr:AAA family ATPase [Candidatus Ozemobacteraceae bacterium]
MTIAKELADHIRARYPLLYLVSGEEARAMAMLAETAATVGKSLWVWSASDGLIDPKGQEVKDAKGEPLVSPLKALRWMLRSQERALFVCKDLHLFLEDPFPQYVTDPIQVRRTLRDISIAFRTSFKTLILLSPLLRIPSELEKTITVFDYPLPTLSEISALLDEMIAELKKLHGDKVTIDLDADTREQIVKSVSGLTQAEIENVFNRAIVNDLRFDRNDIPFILSEKKQIIRKNGILEYYEVQESFGNVGGLEILKDWLNKRGESFTSRAREFGLPEPKGILLLGVQGCGKSLVSKSISSLWRMPLLRLDMGAIFGKYVGESEENLRRAMRTAEALAPTILWLDEIEKAFAGVGGSSGDGGVTTRIFGSFITWMQEKTAPVFVIATANSIENLPPELLRKGRFDEIFFVDLPSQIERESIFDIHLRKRRRDPKAFDLPELGRCSEGFSGAEIEQAVIAGLFEAFHEKRDLQQKDVVESLAATVPLSVTMREQIDKLRSWASQRAKPASAGSPPVSTTPGSTGRPGLNLFADLDLDRK